MRTVTPPAPGDLAAAEQAVREVLDPTPLLEHDRLWLKAETLQPTGSFKVRGALAALAAAPPEAQVVTASAGNHGLGLAWAARRLGRMATVVVAETASPAKVERLRALGADLVLHGDSYDAAEAHALALGGTFISPYNDPHVIAGQRTLGVELGAQLPAPPTPLTVVVPVGGGGLVSGVALWAAGRGDVRVVGVEAAASRAVSASVAAGRVVEVDVGPTLADGMAGGIEPGSVTVALARAHVHAWCAVTEAELRAAMRFLALEAGLVVEGSGAAATAAVLAGRVPAEGHVVAVVSGRNVTAATLAEVLRESA